VTEEAIEEEKKEEERERKSRRRKRRRRRRRRRSEKVKDLDALLRSLHARALHELFEDIVRLEQIFKSAHAHYL